MISDGFDQRRNGVTGFDQRRIGIRRIWPAAKLLCIIVRVSVYCSWMDVRIHLLIIFCKETICMQKHFWHTYDFKKFHVWQNTWPLDLNWIFCPSIAKPQSGSLYILVCIFGFIASQRWYRKSHRYSTSNWLLFNEEAQTEFAFETLNVEMRKTQLPYPLGHGATLSPMLIKLVVRHA